jgi:hypothetical protein
MELLKAALKSLDAGAWVPPADGQRTLVAACDGKIGAKGV